MLINQVSEASKDGKIITGEESTLVREKEFLKELLNEKACVSTTQQEEDVVLFLHVLGCSRVW